MDGVVLSIGAAIDVGCAIASEGGVEEQALMVGCRDLILKTLAEKRAGMDIKALIAKEVYREIVFEHDRDLHVIGKYLEVEPLILQGALATHRVVRRGGTHKLLEGAKTHTGVEHLGLNGEMVAYLPTA